MGKIDLAEIQRKGHGTLTESLGIELIEANEEQVVATMPVDHRTRQPFGLLHGGASVALAETVVSIGALLRVQAQGKLIVGVEINANHLRPVKSGTVKAVATPVHVGKTSQVWETKIYNEEGKMVCISRCTLAIIDAEKVSASL